MAGQEMSGKALLNKLYSGLDTMPATEIDMDARDLRRLTDDFLGKPVEPAASVPPPPAARVAPKARPASRSTPMRTSVMVLFSFAVVGTLAAAALREVDKRVAVPAPAPVVVPVVEAPPPVQVAAEVPAPKPVVLTNPFDASEKFTFPPGTSKAEARDQMAALLLQRATERGAHLPKNRKLANEPRTRSTGKGS